MKMFFRNAMFTGTIIFLTGFLIFRSTFVNASEFLMKNGDKLTGTLVKLDNGEVHITSPYAGDIVVKLSDVKAFRTNHPIEIRSHQGWTVKGKATSLSNGKLQVVTKKGKKKKVALMGLDEIESINPKKRRWEGSLLLGGATQSGNTDRNSITFAGKWQRAVGKRDRVGADFLFNYTEEDGEPTTRNTFGSAKYDHFFSQKLYSYFAVSLLNDKFKNLNLRATVGPGAGYQIWGDPNRLLELEAGLAYFSEDLIDGEDDQWLTGRLGINFGYLFFEHFYFSNRLEVFPNFDDFGEFTSRNEASITTQLNSHWSFKVTNIFEHNSMPAPDVKKNDTTTIYSVQYAF